jgi:glycosyltransferase involved in cell wall biosynthesis
MPSVFFISLMAGTPWGGSEEIWYKTALLAQRRGWKVGCAVYHWEEKEKKMQPLRDAGADIFYFPNKGREKRNLIERIQNKVSKQRIKKVIPTLPINKYDLVVVNMGAFENTTPAWRDFYKSLDRYMVLYHNYKEHEVLSGVKKDAVQNWANNSLLNLFDARRIMDVLDKNSEIKIPNGDVLLNPLSFPVPSTPSPFPPLQNGNYRFIMLAALELWRKAQDNLVKALSSEKWKERNWTLHLYGDGKDREKLETLIQANGMAGKIFLEGYTSNVQSALENAHLLFQITYIDAMPLVIVEAMAMGRAAVVSRIGDMPRWVNEAENGWISPDASIEQIDATLEKAWQQKEQWKQMGENAFSVFQKKYPAPAEEILLDKIEALVKRG